MPAAQPIRTDSGNKVGWEIYATEAQARARAKTARKQAAEKSLRGYDFGYQSPGSVTKVADGWKVCVP